MPKKVLIIDDSSSVRRQLSTALGKAGFVVLEAADGMEGAEQIRAETDLALVICDVNMPRMSGLDLLERLQPELAQRQLPVVMLTTEGQPEAMTRAKKWGAKGWIVKPFKEQLLLGAVQKLTQSA
ncbi:MAG TPA: response regulator [Polyangiaceae bacterium]|jgi:two-component system chemotaxis response regulator CheY|nr:response regulator [Polyangiaceae bacterium]